MAKLGELWEQLREKLQESDAFQQLKQQYDELDANNKMAIQLGGLAAVVLFVLGTVMYGMAKVGGLRAEYNSREDLIGQLQRAADRIRLLQSQQSTRPSGPSSLKEMATAAMEQAGLNTDKAAVGEESQGVADKTSTELLVNIKLSQINLRQLNRLLFQLTAQGKNHGATIKELSVDTKGDPTGYLDATITVASYKAK